MKFAPTGSLGLLWISLAAGLLTAGVADAKAGGAKFEAQLVWATNDTNAPSAKYQPADKETREKLESLGCLKWKNFFVVKKENLEATKDDPHKVVLSDKCAIAVKLLEGKKVEVVLYGSKGQVCSRHVQTLERGEMLVHGGKVPENTTAWLVTLKRLK